MIDPPTEPPFNDRWQGESETTRGDRPGIVASLLRYRVDRGRGDAARGGGRLRHRAAASRPLPGRRHPDPLRPWRPERPRRRQRAREQRPPGLPGQAGGHHDLHGRARACPRAPREPSVAPRSQGRAQRAALGEHGEHLDRRDHGRSTVGGRTGERGRHRLRAGHAGTRATRTRTGDRQPREAPAPLPSGPRRQPQVPGRPS